jgi:type I restriction enzyme, S subunit
VNSVVEIGDIAEVFNGKTPSKSEKRDEGLPILKIKDVTENGKFKGTFESFVDPEFYEKHSKKKTCKGDTLILNAAHNADYVGSKQFKVCEKVDGVIATGEWLIVRPSPMLASNSYINHWLKSGEARFRIRDLVKGIHLYPKDVSRLKIPLPPLEEQKRIAAILDKADALRRKRQQAIDLTDQLLRSVFLNMFGDLSDFPMVQIKEIAAKSKYSLSSGPFGSNLTSKHYESNGIIVLRGTNVTSGRLNLDNVKYISIDKAEELKRSKVCPDDIVIVAVGSSGHAFKIPKSLSFAVMSQNFNKVTPNKDKVTPIYLEYCFNSPLVQRQFKQNITDTVRTFLSLTKIKEVKIPLPPLEDQVQFESSEPDTDS